MHREREKEKERERERERERRERDLYRDSERREICSSWTSLPPTI